MTKQKSVLITGATGFIGQHLISDFNLLSYKVTIITRKDLNLISQKFPGCTVINADLTDKNQMIEACKGIDIVINLAAEVRNSDKLVGTNIKGTENLIEAIKINHIKKVIHLSSVGVVGCQYSNNEINVHEKYTCKPLNEYERTKLVSENLWLKASDEIGFKLYVLRPTNVFGENHPFNALLGLMKHARAGKSLIYFKNAMVNYVYVKDVCSFILFLLQNEAKNVIFNVGQPMPLCEFYAILCDVMQIKNRALLLPDFLLKVTKIFKLNTFNTISNKVRYEDTSLTAIFAYPYGYTEGIKRTFNYYSQQKLIN